MKVNLFADYRGVLTNEAFYRAGKHDLPDGIAQALIAAGRAMAVEEPEQKPAEAPKVITKPRGRKQKAK